MYISSNKRRAAVAALGVALLAPAVAPLSTVSAAPTGLADPAFQSVWDRTDRPVEAHLVNRTWMWGPDAFKTTYEPYQQGPAGQHLVTYFDKSRMEINNPSGNRNAEWFVTNGLLVVDMMSGQVQVGDRQFAPAKPADIPVAGDVPGSPDTPTYASLGRVASLHSNNRAANRVGRPISEGIARTGGVGNVSNLAGMAKYGVYEPTTGHNIADVFWTFMNQQGPIYSNGNYVNGTVVDWLFAMGYPITEPYWIKIRVSGQDRWVLMQAFQRRILTYSPWNPQGWKVEMGNVGRAYFDWRYSPAPAPTPVPTASISLSASSGPITAPVTVTGSRFPAYAAVNIDVQNAGGTYSRTVSTIGVKADGTFASKITLPTAAAKYGRLTIRAIANGGAVNAAQFFQVQAVLPAYSEVVTNHALSVSGVGFPAGRSITVGALFNGTTKPVWLVTTAADQNGNFTASINPGNRVPGTTFYVVAQADNGFRVQSTSVRMIAQPTLQVIPASGGGGVTVTLRGTHWPVNRDVQIGRKPVETKGDLWLQTIKTDANGNFSARVYLGPEYNKKTQAQVMAFDSVSNVRVDAYYKITR